MSYRQANQILPEEIINMIQQYVDGECIYIPRKENERRKWGENSKIREELSQRNDSIFEDYMAGLNVFQIANKYFLSEKSIQRIICTRKKAA